MYATYDQQVFQKLNPFHIAKEELRENKSLLPTLGEVICKYDLSREVGICLLHKHFDLYPNEKLVEQFVNNSAFIKPYSDVADSDAIPYLWKVEGNLSLNTFTYYPLEFIHINSCSEEIRRQSEVISLNEEFLKNMAASLAEMSLCEIFGISILHRDNEILAGHDEVIVENTDSDDRILNISAVQISEVDSTDLTQTLWSFNYQTTYISGQCISHCIQHCNNHCRGHR